MNLGRREKDRKLNTPSELKALLCLPVENDLQMMGAQP